MKFTKSHKIDEEKILKHKRSLSTSKKDEFIEGQIQELLRLGFDEETLREQLEEVGVSTISKMPEDVEAFYRNGEMFFLRKDIGSKKNREKRLRTHETIHGILGTYSPEILDGAYGIEEGVAENITEILYGDPQVYASIKDKVNFYLSHEVGYPYDVCIVRQLEYILGKSSVDIASKGDRSFLQEIKNKFGVKTYKYIIETTNSLSKTEINDKEKIDELKQLQKVLLTHTFDKEFEKVTSLKSAEKYLERLRGFERTRAAILGDMSFKTYYMGKLNQISELLTEKGTEKEKIQELLEKYKYLGWTINPEETEEEKSKRIKSNLKAYLVNTTKYKEQITLDFIQSLEVRYYLRNGVECQVILKKGIPFGGIIRNTVDGSAIIYKVNGNIIDVIPVPKKKKITMTFNPKILTGEVEGFSSIDLSGDMKDFTKDVLTEVIEKQLMEKMKNLRKSQESEGR